MDKFLLLAKGLDPETAFRVWDLYNSLSCDFRDRIKLLINDDLSSTVYNILAGKESKESRANQVLLTIRNLGIIRNLNDCSILYKIAALAVDIFDNSKQTPTPEEQIVQDFAAIHLIDTVVIELKNIPDSNLLKELEKYNAYYEIQLARAEDIASKKIQGWDVYLTEQVGPVSYKRKLTLKANSIVIGKIRAFLQTHDC